MFNIQGKNTDFIERNYNVRSNSTTVNADIYIQLVKYNDGYSYKILLSGTGNIK